ncbi:MAG TPA: MtnX-like HAD-IB family phosphatase [Syntrophales bacterium]
METKKPLLVITDFDGTLSLTDVGYEVLLKFSGQGWDDIDREYCEGRIGSMEAYGRIAAILGGTREDMLRFVAENTVIDPHFKEFYAFCREHGIDVKVVSDGLDFYIDFILKKHGLSDIPFYSNVMTFHDGKPRSIEFPHANETCNKCGTCKSNILESCQAGYGKIVYVGDGYSDLCPARKADLVFAKGILWTRLSKKEQEGVRKYRSFRDVTEFLSNNGLKRDR